MGKSLNKENQVKIKKVTFGNNELAIILYGESNRNLRLIEKKLHVIINIRGNDVVLQGGTSELEIAERLLIQLYELIPFFFNSKVA